jgi:hypothetical protein
MRLGLVRLAVANPGQRHEVQILDGNSYGRHYFDDICNKAGSCSIGRSKHTPKAVDPALPLPHNPR